MGKDCGDGTVAPHIRQKKADVGHPAWGPSIPESRSKAETAKGLWGCAEAADGDGVAGGVFDGVHHFVGLADEVVGAFGVLREGGDAEGGADVDVDAFAEVELSGAQQVAEAAGDDEGGLFIGLGEQDDEFIAAVAEGVVDEAEVVLDGGSDFGEQAAADEVSAAVIDQLEVVEVEEDDAELVAEA